jgi:hypothetical protein
MLCGGKVREARLKTYAERVKALTVIEVGDKSQMPQIKWNVCLSLSDQNDFATERVCYANLVKHVRISVCAVTDKRVKPIRLFI